MPPRVLARRGSVNTFLTMHQSQCHIMWLLLQLDWNGRAHHTLRTEHYQTLQQLVDPRTSSGDVHNK